MSEGTAEPASAREIGVAAAVLILLASLVLFVTDAGVLLTRPLWVDEILTVLVASHGSPLQVLGDLASGADGGASLFHLSMWLLGVVAGGLTPLLLRIVALACVLAALLAVYRILRGSFSRLPSAAGTLAIGANALVIEHAYEARFYGPWLLCAALVALLLARRQRLPADRRTAVALGIVSFLLCTIHFYGVITLGVMAIVVVASYGREWRTGVRVVAPTGWGLLGLAAVIPLAIAQRVAYSVPSWLPDFQIAQLREILADFWLVTIPLVAAVVIVVAMTFGRTAAATGVVQGARRDAGVVALAALALMPLALALLSAVGQPSMLPRYAIGAALAWGPWVALAATLGGRWIARVMLPFLLWFWIVGYTKEARLKSTFRAAVGQATAAFEQARRAGGSLPIVFTSIHVMYPVVLGSGGAERAWFLDLPDSTFRRLFPDSTPLGQANRVVVLERDLARVHTRRFGFPRLVEQGRLEAARQFLLLAPDGRLPAGFTGVPHLTKTLFPEHDLRRLMPDLWVLERKSVGLSQK